MHIRRLASLRRSFPGQDLIAQRTITYRPSCLLPIHCQQIICIQRQIPRRLLRCKKLQFFLSLHGRTVVQFRPATKRRYGDRRKRTGR